MSGTIHVLVDDADPIIEYHGPWFQAPGIDIGDWGLAWNNTLHGTQSNASLTFTFKGTWVDLYTTNTAPNAAQNPVWKCSIDGVAGILGDNTTTKTNNLNSCSSPSNLEDTTHVFTVDVTVPEGQTAWVDYLDYSPSVNISLINASVLIENSSPYVQYSHGWVPLEDILMFSQNDVSSSATSTIQTGASVHISFTGISLAWYGLATTFVPNSPAPCTYSIDGASPVTFQTIGRDIRSPVDTEYYIVIFQTQNLTWGPHTIDVVYKGTPQDTPLILDYIMIQNQTSPVLESIVTTLPSTSAPTSLPTPPNTNITMNTSTSTPHGANLGSVIGGSFVGAVALVMLVLAGFLYLRRRKRNIADSNKAVMAQPFTNAAFRPISPMPQISTSVSPPPYDYIPRGISYAQPPAAFLTPDAKQQLNLGHFRVVN